MDRMSDKKWQAQCDARTLREAERIKADKMRHRAAQTQAKNEMNELAKVVTPAPRKAAVRKTRSTRAR